MEEKYSNTYICFYCDKPKSFKALNAVAKATSSGVLDISAAIISTIAGRLQGYYLNLMTLNYYSLSGIIKSI